MFAFILGTTQGNFQKVDGLNASYFLNHSIKISDVKLKSYRKSILSNCSPLKNLHCVFINNPNGFWEKESYRHSQPMKYQYKNVDSKSFDTLLVFGDSITLRFYFSLRATRHCKYYFKRCKSRYTWAYVRSKYFTPRQEMYLYDNKDFNETLFFGGISDAVIEQKDMESPKSVLILNFGLHLIKAITTERLKSVFDKFLNLITLIKNKLGRNSPLFIWKTATPGIPSYTIVKRFMTIQV